jgi:hypothetical protein
MVVEVRDLRKYSSLFIKDLERLREGMGDSVLDSSIYITNNWILGTWNNLGTGIPGVQIQYSFLIYCSCNWNLSVIRQVTWVVTSQVKNLISEKSVQEHFFWLADIENWYLDTLNSWKFGFKKQNAIFYSKIQRRYIKRNICFALQLIDVEGNSVARVQNS